MAAYKNIIVAGATGFLGKEVVKALVSSGFNVSILSRDIKKNLPNAKTIITDYSDSSLQKALRNQDVVVSTIGALGIASQYKLIDAAIAVGVKRFIPSDYAPNTLDLSSMESAVPQLYARLKPRQDVIKYLQQRESNTFSWSAIGSFPLFEWAMMTGAQGISLKTRSALITDSGNEPFIMTTVGQIARAISQTINLGEAASNKYLLVKSFQTSQNELVKILQEKTKKEWKVDYISSGDQKKEGLQMLSNGNFAGLGRLWNVWLNTDGKGFISPEEDFANELLQLPDEDLEGAIARILQSQ